MVVSEERTSSTVRDFCARHDISISTYYKMKNAGRGPQEFYIENTPRIAIEDESAWLATRKAAAISGEDSRAWLKARARKAGTASIASPNHVTKAKSRGAAK